MKATELMIGDYVIFQGEYWKIAQIDGDYDTVVITKLNSNTFYNTSLDKIEPIQLTPELLELNGFTIQNELYHSGNIWISADRRIILDDSEEMINSLGKNYSVHIDNQCMDSILTCEVTYVHELQNAFKLAGYEMVIKVC